MKRTVLVLVLVSLLLATFAIAPARAEEMPFCSQLNAVDFAAHVAAHAKEGTLSGLMNPGVHHHGYSVCVVPYDPASGLK